jgi:uncharacterized protein YodC (DUF2158 family)
MRDAKGRYHKPIEVGDRFRLKASHWLVKFGHVEPGYVLEIKNVFDSGASGRSTCGHAFTLNQQVPHHAELVKDAPAPSHRPVFETGDVVRIKRWLGEWEVDVVEAERCRCTCGGGFHWAKIEDMTLVRKGEKAKPEPKSEPKPISPGSVVRLKSGGPDMTVETSSASEVVCVYFVDSCHVRRPFSPVVLEVVR